MGSQEDADSPDLLLRAKNIELAAIKVFLTSIIEGIGESLVVIDIDSKIKLVNRTTLDLLGYTQEDLIREPVELLFGEAVGREGKNIFTTSALKKLLKEGSEGSLRDYESNFKTKKGEIIPILLSGSILRDREGKSEGVVVVAKDIRERKRLELMLVQSEKLSAVGQLAAGVAHEINNPLGIILGFAQSAAKRIQASDALSLPIKSIEREAMRCKNLVQNLLTFSRQNKPKMEEIDLNEIVTSTLSIIEAQARVKSVEVFKELGILEPLMGDKNQLQQIIVNLCNNAIDAMPNGGKIIVRTKVQFLYGDRRLILEIEDTGSGIPEDIQDKVFNPFFTTKEVGKGTGLGLSLVHEIVQRHQGTIKFTSEVGHGTTFIVSLPPKGSVVGQTANNGT